MCVLGSALEKMTSDRVINTILMKSDSIKIVKGLRENMKTGWRKMYI